MNRRLKQGDYYPELRHARIEPYTMIIHEMPKIPPRDWLDQQARFAVEERTVPAVRVQIPEHDWETIMEIYRSHYHAMENNPSVQAAWEQYKMLVRLTR